jgi:hypothetical protein
MAKNDTSPQVFFSRFHGLYITGLNMPPNMDKMTPTNSVDNDETWIYHDVSINYESWDWKPTWWFSPVGQTPSHNS